MPGSSAVLLLIGLLTIECAEFEKLDLALTDFMPDFINTAVGTIFLLGQGKHRHQALKGTKLSSITQTDLLSNVTSAVSSVEQGGGTVEQHPINVEESQGKKKLNSDFKIRENELLDKQIQLENTIKELDNILVKTGQSIQTMHMLSPKPDSFYHTEQKMALRYHNLFYLKQALQKPPSLYNGKVLLEKYDPPAMFDSKETLELSQKKAAKFVRDFKSLAKEADESIAKHKALKLEIERLLRAVVDKMKDLLNPVTSNSVPTTNESKVVDNEKVIAPGMFRIYPFKNTREEKSVPSKLNKASIRKNPITVPQPYVITNKVVNSDSHGFSSTRVDITTKTISYPNMFVVRRLRNDLVTVLPKLKYHKEPLCPSYEQGKRKRASHPPKPVLNSKQRLYLLHMDLCGPMRIASINGKRYVLVIMDDYSRYTWVIFLKLKDEAPEEMKSFLKKITVLLQALVIIVRTDNDTEFKNQALCYPKNDRKDIEKLRAKGDIGFFIGYSVNSRAYRVYNRRTKLIMETMNVTFDDSGLDLPYAPSTITTQKPTEGELDLLFESMYDDHVDGQPPATPRTVLAAQAP
nr:retrotransposon protein, putative, Ty1-copia subclass [Tanacetum cinerariifolium]